MGNLHTQIACPYQNYLAKLSVRRVKIRAMNTSQKDQLHRFIFDNTAVRGNTVQLNNTFTTSLQHHNYPPVLKRALGELMAASALLAATLKIEGGALVLQIQGKGALKLLVVECKLKSNAEAITMRATATLDSNVDVNSLDSLSFGQLVGKGQFIITLDLKNNPKDGNQAYQGIVPIEGDSIAAMLENYMHRSEQIETRIWLSCDDKVASGMLLQKLPDLPEQDADAWNRLGYLANTVRDEELLNLSAEDLLHLMFSEEDVRLFDAQAISFSCSCSQTSVGNMLRLLGEVEINSILQERDTIEVNCDFCNKHYEFDKVDAEQLFAVAVPAPTSKAKH